MKNNLIDLQNHIFEMIQAINDDSLTEEQEKRVITRGLAINELAKTAIRNGELMQKTADTLYGLPILESLPLLKKDDQKKKLLRD